MAQARREPFTVTGPQADAMSPWDRLAGFASRLDPESPTVRQAMGGDGVGAVLTRCAVRGASLEEASRETGLIHPIVNLLARTMLERIDEVQQENYPRNVG